jgi:hypothetical protein
MDSMYEYDADKFGQENINTNEQLFLAANLDVL